MRYARAVMYALMTVAMYLLPPLVGWGLDDAGGFLALAPRAGYAAAVVVLGVAAGTLAVVAPASYARRRPVRRVLRQWVVARVIMLLLYVALILLPWSDRRGVATLPVGAAVRWVGLVLVALGFVLVFWSGVALGPLYSPDVAIQQDHALVTTGLYRAIRHPRYLGGILAAAGYPLLFRAGIGVALLPLWLAAFAFRIWDEERVMHETFGAAWEAYVARSWRLVPGIF